MFMSQAASPTSPPQPGATRRKSRWKRWTLRLLICLVILLAIIVVGGQIIFTTDLPRDLVIHAVEKSLGLRVSAESLSTGWFGNSTLHNVTFSLPLSDKNFISIPELRLRHTPLPVLLATGSFDIKDISLDHPTLTVHQQPGGEWNLLEVLQLVSRAFGGNPQKPHTNEIPVLPNLHVADGTLTLQDDKNRSTTIEHLSIDGTSQGALVWQYHASVPGQLDVTGKVAPGGPWFHEVDMQAQNIQPWMTAWFPSWPASAHAKAHWSGKIDNDHLTGRLDIDSAEYGGVALSGPVDIVAFSGPLTIHPAGLRISNPTSHALIARLDDGQLAMDSDIQFRQLLIGFAGGHATVDGNFALGRPSFNLVLDGSGSVKAGQWNAHIALVGNGVSYDSLSMSLTAQTLRFQANNGKSLDLSGLYTDFGSYPGGFALTTLHLGSLNSILARGGYDFKQHIAWLSLDGRSISLPTSEINSLDFDLNLWSSPQRVHLQQLYLRGGPLSADLFGEYVFKQDNPFKAHLAITQFPPTAPNGGANAAFRGSLQCGIDLEGTASPLDLNLTGYANGSDLYIGQQSLGDPKLTLSGQVRDGVVFLASNNIQLFGGLWNVGGHWPVRNGLFHLDSLSVQHLNLAQLLGNSHIAGTLDGKWTVDVQHLVTTGILVDGSASISGLSYDNRQLLTIDQIQMPSVQVAGGFISVWPITLIRKTSDNPAQAQAGIWTTVSHPSQMTVYLNTDSWPLRDPSLVAAANLWAKGSMDVDLARKSANGHVALRVDGSWNSHPVGRLDSDIDVFGRQVDAKEITIHALNGSASGHGSYDFDHFDQAHLNLAWKDLDLAQLNQISPELGGAAGKVDGSLKIAAATTTRPLEPLAFDMHLASNAVHIGSFAIGDARIGAYLGPNRIVLDDAPSRRTEVAFAGGTIALWGRVSQPFPGLYQSLIELNLENLDLNALVPAGAKTNRAPGLLGGRITIVGRPGNTKYAFGQGTLTLTHSDLAGTGPIGYLYNLMHITHDPKKPVGTGTIDFVIQDNDAYITALRYSDRGREVRLSGVIQDLPKIPKSHINLVAVGSVRPFASIDIPGLADIDQALSAVQRDAVTIQITNTFDHPKWNTIAFSEIGQDMKNLLFGDAKAAQ